MRRASIAAFLLGLAVIAASARAEEALSLEGKIALPGVAGRIDHMAVDLGRKRLLVAALGNGTLEIVDLEGGHRVKQVTGLREPQGVGYAQKADLVVVASAGDGSVRFSAARIWQPPAASRWAATPTMSASTRAPAMSSSDTAAAGWRSSIPRKNRRSATSSSLHTRNHSSSTPRPAGSSSTFRMPAKSRLSTLQRQDRWRAGRYRVCGQISRSQSTVPAR